MSDTECLIVRCLKRILMNQSQMLKAPDMTHWPAANETDKLINDIETAELENYRSRLRDGF